MVPIANHLFFNQTPKRTRSYLLLLRRFFSPASPTPPNCKSGSPPSSLAFLTIHGGNACRSTINELQVYDIKNLQQPVWLKSFAMTHPLGLALQGQYLYVCDQEKGLYVLDVSTPENPVVKNIITGEIFIDVIADASSQTLIAMLSDGIALYDMANPLLL